MRMHAQDQDSMSVDETDQLMLASSSIMLNGSVDSKPPNRRKRAAASSTQARSLHRCRFPDWSPSTISAIAITPSTFDTHLLNFGGNSGERGILGVGKVNGDVELMLWGGVQGWVAWRTLPSSFPPPQVKNSKKPSPLLSHLLFTHQTTLSTYDLDLFHGDIVGAEREVQRWQREGCRLFGVGGVGSELVEWEWGGPGSSTKGVGRIKSTLPTLPPIFALAASSSQAHLAIGCEDSTIRILNILDDELELISRIEVGGPGKVRALSLAWGPPISGGSSVKPHSAGLTALVAAKGKAREESPDVSEASSLPTSFATSSESFLIAGCSNSSIRRYNIPSSGLTSGVWRATHHMTVDRVKGEHTVVWSLAILGADGNTFVSGDSMGNIKFWDSKMGTQLQSFKTHKADVLTIAVGSDGTNLFTSGIDQKTAEFRLTNVASSKASKAGVETSRWIQASGRRLHSHDVRGMVMSPPYTFSSARCSDKGPMIPILTSGGLDLSLVIVAASSSSSSSKLKALQNPVSSTPSIEFESTVHRKASFVPQRGSKPIIVAGNARLLVCKRDRSLGIWKLNPPPLKSRARTGIKGLWRVTNNDLPSSTLGQDVKEEEDVYNIEEDVTWEKLLEMELQTQTNLISSAISNDGKWLAVSDLYETKLFNLLQKDGKLTPRRQKTFSSALHEALPTTLGTGSSLMLFSKDSRRLIVGSAFGSSIAVVSLPKVRFEDNIVVEKVFRQHGARVTAAREVKGRRGTGEAKPKMTNGHAGPNMNGVHRNGKKHLSSSSEDNTETDASISDDAMDEDDNMGEEESIQLQLSADRSASLSCMAISNDGQWLASADIEKKVCVFNLSKLEYHATLPTSSHVPSSLAFLPYAASPSSKLEPTLLLALPNNALSLFGLTSLRFHPSALPLSSPRSNVLMNNREPILDVYFEPVPGKETRGRAVSPANEQIAVVWGANWVAKIDMKAVMDMHYVPELRGSSLSNSIETDRRKPRKRVREEDTSESLIPRGGVMPKFDIKVVRKYQPLLLFDTIGDGEFIAVERTWFDLAKNLPEAWVRSGEYGS